MNSKTRRLLIAVLVVVCAAVAIWWWNQEWVLRNEYVLQPGNDNIVYSHRFYAAERLLKRLQIDAEGIRSLSNIAGLGRKDTLLLNTSSYLLGQRRGEELLQWVADGGHLIFAVGRSYDPAGLDGDTLLDALALMVEETDTPATVVNTRIDNGAQSMRVYFDARFELRDEKGYAFRRIADDQHTYLLQYGWDEGLITVLSSLRMFDNNSIDEYDHADFFWYLLRQQREPGKVWLQYAPQVPSLLELLWQYAWMLILALCLTLAAIIWSSNLAFGPKLLIRDSGQRRLAEHLRASARFLWRQGASETLIDAVRERVRQKLQQRHPHWQQLTDLQRIDYIAGLTDIKPEQINAALFIKANSNVHDFQQIIRTLNRIETKV